MCEEHWDFESDPFDHDNEFPCDEYGRKLLTCHHCGEGNLHWENFGGGWRLCDPLDDRHLCQAVEPDASDFDDLT